MAQTSDAADLGAGLEAPPDYEESETADEDETELGAPTVYFSMTGGGHDYISPTSPHDPEGEKPVYIHRLAAYAWGILDAVGFRDDPRHVHHEIPDEWRSDESNAGVPWFTAEGHLRAEQPDEHATCNHFASEEVSE
jgi:hypothetical protein